MALLVDLRGVSLSFGGVPAVRDLDLDLHTGELVGLCGAKGAGKTAVLDLVVGAHQPTAGRVFYAGRDITTSTTSTRARLGIAYVRRRPRPLPGLSVGENLLLAATRGRLVRTGRQLGRVVELAERAGLAAAIDQRAERLALVDRKRLELARAVAPRPRVVLIDELSHGLEPAEASALDAIVRQFHQTGLSIIWAERHPRTVAPFADRLVALAAGHKVTEGPPGEVLGSPDLPVGAPGVTS